MSKAILIASGAMAAVLLAALLAFSLTVGWVAAPSSVSQREVVVEIPHNIDGELLSELLVEAKLINRATVFRWYIDSMRTPGELKGGEYALNAVMSPYEMVDQIARGAVVTYTVTIPAGARSQDVATVLADADLGDAAALQGVLEDRSAVRQMGVPSDSLEGYLFPDSYALPKGLAPQELVKRLVDRYRTIVDAELMKDASDVGLTEHELITLASLIELDGVPKEERSMLSSVYHNRLALGMKLENLGSVAYGLGKAIEDVSREDLATDHAWNTYLQEGLPPTPVSNPGKAAIYAAARPARSDSLYWAPRDGGTHVFCPDAECHRIALDRWREAQAKARERQQ